MDAAHFPPVTSKYEVILSPAFELSLSLPKNHCFKKPLHVSLPLEVPLRARDCGDSGWLLQLKRSKPSDGLISEWQTVLELSTKTGEVMSRSSFIHYDCARGTGTLGLDHFCRFAWLGKPLKAVGSMLCFRSLRQIMYAVFGKEIQHHKWRVAVHIIHGSKLCRNL